MKRTVILIILDGWGIGGADESNPIYVVNPQNINYLKANFPAGALQASGISVGLPWGEEGNSEVGHLNIGAGKIMYQHYPKITMAIKDQSFFKNDPLKKAFEHARKNNSAVNLVGLLSSGHVHSSIEHLKALIKFAEQEKISKLNLHLFADGRDSSPNSAAQLLGDIPKESLASLSGRFYAMDRENNWERTEKAYQTLIGNGPVIEPKEIENHIKKTYEKNLNDEYIEPTLIGPASATASADAEALADRSVGRPENRGIQDNDALIFFNFREDRMRQIVSPFVVKGFNKFPITRFANLYVTTMTKYDDSFGAPAAFSLEKSGNPLGKVLAQNNKTQLRIAETQKYPHITYFFNSLRKEPFKNEYRVLIPSKSTIRPEEHPEMMAREITSRLIESIEEGVFDFILANFANPDTIAHTGNYEASLEAVRITDEQVGKITRTCLNQNTVLIITSDHGNIERVFNPQTGSPETQHDASLVPIYLVAKEFERKKTEKEIREADRGTIGILSDIAPTILELMDILQPQEMTGQSLVKVLTA